MIWCLCEIYEMDVLASWAPSLWGIASPSLKLQKIFTIVFITVILFRLIVWRKQLKFWVVLNSFKFFIFCAKVEFWVCISEGSLSFAFLWGEVSCCLLKPKNIYHIVFCFKEDLTFQKTFDKICCSKFYAKKTIFKKIRFKIKDRRA